MLIPIEIGDPGGVGSLTSVRICLAWR